ncbi:zinc finger protein 532-like isoform X2 [Ostrea edulis]|uniref:zinc finger protein 532-like isoform X2 n=2 Tax=Ostrea edulis TaxID=37623 RepID=UPI0024AFC162|nr:zinc finger protein 532-like isoform X2 [Ostrea edulis]
MSSFNQLEEASLLLGLQTEKILPSQTKMGDDVADLKHGKQENGTMCSGSMSADPDSEDNVGLNSTPNNTLDEAPEDKHKQLNTPALSEITHRRAKDQSTDEDMMVDPEERNDHQPKSQLEKKGGCDENASVVMETMQMPQSEQESETQITESNSVEMCEEPKNSAAEICASELPDPSDTDTQVSEEDQLSHSPDTCSQENSFDNGMDRCKSSPGVISFENMDSTEESDQHEAMKGTDVCLSEQIEVDGNHDELENLEMSQGGSTEKVVSESISKENESSPQLQRMRSVAFGEEESLNESIDEDSDGRLFIDTEIESGDADDEDLSRRGEKQYTDSPLAARKLPGQQIRESPLAAEKIPSQQVTESPLAAEKIPSQQVTESPLAAEKIPSQQVTESPLAAEKIPSQQVTESPLAAEKIPSQQITESPLAAEKIPSKLNRKTPLEAEILPSQQIRERPLAVEKIQSLQKDIPGSVSTEHSGMEVLTTENSGMLISDKDAMLQSVSQNSSRSEPSRTTGSQMEVSETSDTEITDGGPTITTTRTPMGAVIKVEQIDEGYSDSQTGDILDILHKSKRASTQGTEQQKRKLDDMNDKDAVQPLSFNAKDIAKRVKKEPVDIFESPKSNCSMNVSPVTGFLPGSSFRPRGPTTGVVSNSLLQLSKQVDSITTQQNQQTAPSLCAVSSAAHLQPPSPLLRHQLNSGIRFPPRVSRISIPFVRAQRPAITQSEPRMRPSISRALSNSSTTVSNAGRATQGQSVMLTPQTKTVPSLMNSTSTFRYRLVPHAGGQSLVTVPSVTKPATTVSSASSSKVPSTPSNEAMSSCSINIDTVGMQTITELIARKNPLPNYKITPAPSEIKVNNSVFTCYECGDTFRFSTSLETHRGRCSMKITYKCEECKSMKIFFNKCQFLSHLRGHLNIEKTQAVPIHIKSDSISIEPLSKSHQQVFFQKFSVSKKTNNQKASRRCAECGTTCSQAEFEKHFLGDKKAIGGLAGGKWRCVHCKLYFPSICAQRAHARLHKEEELDKKFTCPECGIDQSGLMVGDQQFDNYEEKLSFHVINVCFHLDKTDVIVCSKCSAEFTSMKEFRHHYFKKLEQYFKCNVCPMAFRQQESFTKHLNSQHSDHEIVSLSPAKKKMDVFKVIYRCHVCDSLIDDRFVLDNHLQQHATVTKSVYKCKECSRTFQKGEEMSNHFKAEHADKTKLKLCKKCNKTFETWKELLSHTLKDVHATPPDNSFHYCGTCGFFYDPTEAEGGHICMSQKTGKLVVNKFLSGCRICNERKFYNATALRIHLQAHQDRGYLVCKYCQSGGFSSKEEMKIHESICNDGKSHIKPNILRHKKSAASSSSKDVKKMVNDVKPVNPQLSFPCMDCDEQFTSKADLGNHQKEAHSNLYPCHLCGLTYESQQSLRKHLRVTHEGKTHVYPCVICRKRGIRRIFTNVLVLEKHLATKHRVSKNQMSSSIVNEFAAENEILNPPPKSIKSPSESTELIKEIDSPVKRLHIEGDQVFNCAKCRFRCENRTGFLDHLKVHKIDNSVQCLECGLCFAIIPSLKKHLFMVHKVKDFEEYCQKEGIRIKDEIVEEELEETSYTSLAEESDPEDHDRDPLECRVCYRVFEDDNKLRSHMRSHGMAFIRNKRRERAVQRSRQSASTSSVKSETASENSNASSSDAK